MVFVLWEDSHDPARLGEAWVLFSLKLSMALRNVQKCQKELCADIYPYQVLLGWVPTAHFHVGVLLILTLKPCVLCMHLKNIFCVFRNRGIASLLILLSSCEGGGRGSYPHNQGCPFLSFTFSVRSFCVSSFSSGYGDMMLRHFPKQKCVYV